MCISVRTGSEPELWRYLLDDFLGADDVPICIGVRFNALVVHLAPIVTAHLLPQLRRLMLNANATILTMDVCAVL